MLQELATQIFIQACESDEGSSAAPDAKTIQSSPLGAGANRAERSTPRSSFSGLPSPSRFGSSVRQPSSALAARGLNVHQFQHLLLSESNRCFDSNGTGATQDLSFPLSHYWIDAAHQSYRMGERGAGERGRDCTAVEWLNHVLLSGCRAIDLEVCDGDEGAAWRGSKSKDHSSPAPRPIALRSPN